MKGINIHLIHKKNIHVTLKKWSENWWYFEVTEEIKDVDSQWYTCTSLKKTLPIYNLKLLDKILTGDKYKNFFQWKAKKLCEKYQKE